MFSPAESACAHAAPQTVAGVVQVYLNLLDQNLHRRHRENIRHVLGLFIGDLGAMELAQAKPLDLWKWMQAQRGRWKSGHTIKRNNAEIQRAFNWCERAGVIERNPFRSFGMHTTDECERRRAMTNDEFRTLLRHARAPFRRMLLFLRLTGCRPKELRKLNWSQIDFDRAVVVLLRKQHKSGKKTGRPRLIPLVPPIVAMLRWIQRKGRIRYWQGLPVEHEPTAEALREVLRDGPLPLRETTERLRALGVNATYRMLWRARKTAGVIIKAVVEPGRGRYMVYELTTRPEAPKSIETNGGHVFANDEGKPLTRNCLSQKMRRLRKRVGLPDGLSLYCVRHQWATAAIANNVPLKMVSELLGHSDTRMTELYYIHVNELSEPLHKAMQQAVAHTNGHAKKGGQP